MEINFIEKSKHPSFKNIEGQQFGQLLVIGFAGMENTNASWYCECNCLEKIIIKVLACNLKKGNTTSCGCYKIKTKGQQHITHNMSKTVEYKTYKQAKNRCNNQNSPKYTDYGGRGIEFKFKSFEEFFEELGEKPKPKSQYSIERIDVNGNYQKGNVKWATAKEQANNRRKKGLI